LTPIVEPEREIPVGAVVVSVPPHIVEVALVTVSPVGNVSVNATPLKATVFVAGLVIVKVSEVVAFRAIIDGLNVFAIAGGATTVSVSVAVLPVPPLVEDTAAEVLVKLPAVPPVTFTTTVQELFVAMLPPVRLMLVPPAVAEAVPLQLFTRPFGVAITNPVGSVSLKATSASATVFAAGLVRVKVSALVPFSGIELGLNALAIDGGATTVNDAFDVFPVAPLVELTCTLLFFVPEVVP
jgi:hypothetical protein